MDYLRTICSDFKNDRWEPLVILFFFAPAFKVSGFFPNVLNEVTTYYKSETSVSKHSTHTTPHKGAPKKQRYDVHASENNAFRALIHLSADRAQLAALL